MEIYIAPLQGYYSEALPMPCTNVLLHYMPSVL